MDEKIFKAYSRKLMRVLDRIETALDDENYDLARELVQELQEDAQDDLNE